MKILMTGATGLVGKKLGKLLIEHGHELWVVSRNAQKARQTLPFPAQVIEADLNEGLIQADLSQIEGAIHLAGESVASGRWNEERKKRIYDSRVQSTKNLLKSLPSALKVFVSASGVGYYGNRGDEVLAETEPAGDDFLARLCVDWEKAADQVFARVVHLRTGIVLDRDEGALPKMLFPFRLGLGGALGSGKQWMSWIHIDDLVRMYAWSIEDEHVHGAYNAVAPLAVTNKEFTKALAHALGKSVGPSVPKFALKIALGEFADSVLFSQRCSAQKVLKRGFHFHHSLLEKALEDLCAPFREGEELFVAEQFIPAPPEKVFSFFSEAKNLEDITPDSLRFHIQGMSTPEIEQGTQIDYKLKIRGVPAKWKTEIDEWKPPFKFVDNQLQGPYRLWHHTHEFKALGGGTLMTDRVRYQLPMGLPGWLVAGNFVRKDVEKIFAHRRKIIADRKF